jgi:hypothetical protein
MLVSPSRGLSERGQTDAYPGCFHLVWRSAYYVG